MLIAFSESKGYSVRNLKYMAKFAETYPDREFVQQVVAQIPWGHNIVLLDKVADMDERKWLSLIHIYPEEAVREALLNSVVHRDYSFSASNLINIYEDRMEFVSLGGLVSGLELESIFLGVSQSRNPNLAACFYRMRLIESYGTGIGKIQRAYKSEPLQPEFETAKGVFRVTLPNRNETEKSGREFTQAESLKTKKNPGKQQQKVLDFVSKNGKITRKQVEELIGSGSTKAFKLIKELCEKGQMKAQGAGKHSYYVLV